MENINSMENVDLKSILKMNPFGKCKFNGNLVLESMLKIKIQNPFGKCKCPFGKCKFNWKCRSKIHVENEFVWKM